MIVLAFVAVSALLLGCLVVIEAARRAGESNLRTTANDLRDREFAHQGRLEAEQTLRQQREMLMLHSFLARNAGEVANLQRVIQNPVTRAASSREELLEEIRRTTEAMTGVAAGDVPENPEGL